MASKNHDSFLVLIGRFASRRGLSKRSKQLIALWACLLFCILDFFEVSSIARLHRLAERPVIPLKTFAHELIEVPKIISEYIDLKKENEALKLELDALKIKTIMAAGIEKELEELRNTVNLKYKTTLFNAMEKVLGFDKSIYSSHILISHTQNSTHEDSVAITPDGVVGVILEIYPKTAKILPITSQKIAIPVRTKSGEHLIISGTDKNEMVSKEIRSNTSANLEVGEILYTSGEGGIYKEDIPVAEITEIDEIKNEIKAKPLIELDKVSFVWVVEPVDYIDNQKNNE